MKHEGSGHIERMDHMPSPSSAERTQRRKLAYLPPAWPLLAIAVVVTVVVLVMR